MTVQFEHSPIDLDRPSFRLVRLLGGNHTDIDCHLFDAWLDQVEDGGVPYDALSYTWGGKEKAAAIRVNGRKMSVTENLFVALNYLRLEDTDRILWIDAICIDQNNHKERGHQVQQMGEIYKKAELVVVWLGRGSKESDVLIDFLKTSSYDAGDTDRGQRVQSKHSTHTLSATDPGCGVMPLELQAQYRTTLRYLLLRPWFRRVWVLQEIANARKAVIVCGWKFVSTSRFTAAPFLLGIEPDFHSQAVLDVMPGRLRENSWWSQERTLRTLLQKFKGSEASDKRDMVYALLGMSSQVCERNNLRADYEKDLQKLIGDTTSVLLFPGHADTSSFHYIDWSWSYFIQNLETLSSAAFLCAIRRGQFVAWKRLLDRGDIDINWKDEAQRTPLWWASKSGNGEMVEMLATRDDREVNSKDEYGRTPLWIAAEQGHEGVVRELLRHGDVDVNCRDKAKTSPLWIAAERGHKGAVRELLGNGNVDVNSTDRDVRSPLWIAAERGHESVVRELLGNSNVDVNSTDRDVRSPLWIAVERSHDGVVRELLGHGDVDVNYRDEAKRSPLWIAAIRGHKGVVKELLGHSNVDVNCRPEVRDCRYR